MHRGVAYFHTRDPRHVERDLDDIVEHGCDFVVHCCSETDMAYYTRALETIIRMSRDRGLAVYLDPWGVGGVYGGETFSRFVAEHLDVRQVTRDGKSVPAACMNHPAFRDLQREWVQLAARLGAEVCFWDEPHLYFDFPHVWEDWCCRCLVCQSRFRERYGFDFPAELTAEVEEFRRFTIVDLLQHNCRAARERGMRNAVCVLADEGERQFGQLAGTSRWESIVAIPELDIFGTDPYWVIQGGEVKSFVSKHCRRVKELCDVNGKESQAWVMAFAIPAGREDEVGLAIDAMVAAGIESIAAWGYRGSEVIDMRCADPDTVWEIVGQSFRRLAG